ncbi:hypothetical protein DMUE_0492 [Dictyocoela muelleri]|nr:hypothetical protein DMUE_0492 [Dictyocoela muelleri]
MNKQHFSDSLNSFYCKHRRIPREYDIMSSFRSLEEAIKNEENEAMASKDKDNTEEILFEYVSPNSGLRIQHKISIIKNIYEQDLWKWVLRFNEISRICNGDEVANIEVLSQIVNYEIQAVIHNSNHQMSYWTRF